ncbi:hypothetical protein H9K75_11115 [Diaphorobacter aerolatus]|uniref:Serine/threonine protein kinase n=1 Tax=Diaphorobacter aerolatus TaxID=1288495 RepID=A0A7H0GQD2_9BURK|nr:hypothetical protein H9K75_11115 [Diaphorobacter aerolatus]
MPPAATTRLTTDFDAFLTEQLRTQSKNIQRYETGGQWVWIKRTGPLVPAWRYRILRVLRVLMNEPVLGPVVNHGGREAIATEVRRLRDLASRGIRVPAVLAAQDDGFVMSHLGLPGEQVHSLGNVIRAAVPKGAEAVMPLWRQGLAMIDQVHRSGTVLSQAFARNLVVCPDGELACVDFEDDPTAVLPLPVCQVRDALCYAHSTAIYLSHAGALEQARATWQQWIAQPGRSPEFHTVLNNTLGRMRWLRMLPANRSLGRDTERLRAMWDLMRPAP